MLNVGLIISFRDGLERNMKKAREIESTKAYITDDETSCWILAEYYFRLKKKHQRVFECWFRDMKIILCWDVTPCTLVDCCQCFGKTSFSVEFFPLKMEAAGSSNGPRR
jgi:hypothetical protein